MFSPGNKRSGLSLKRRSWAGWRRTWSWSWPPSSSSWSPTSSLRRGSSSSPTSCSPLLVPSLLHTSVAATIASKLNSTTIEVLCLLYFLQFCKMWVPILLLVSYPDIILQIFVCNLCKRQTIFLEFCLLLLFCQCYLVCSIFATTNSLLAEKESKDNVQRKGRNLLSYYLFLDFNPVNLCLQSL